MEPLSAEPLVSVVMPTLNRAELLSESAASVLDQDWDRLELLVLDGGSTDGTPVVLDELARAHPSRVRIETFPGEQIEKLNHGFRLAEGDLLMTVGDDDLLLPGALKRLVGALVEPPPAVAAYPDYHHVDLSGRVIATARFFDHSGPEALRLHTCPPAFALFRRELLDEVGEWDPSLGRISDWDFWIRADEVGEIRHVRDTLAALRVHDGQLSHARGPEVAAERIRLVDKQFDRDDVPDELMAVRNEAYRTAYISAALLIDHDHERPNDRYVIEDTLVTIHPPPGAEPRAHASLDAVGLRTLERLVAMHQEEVAALERAVAARAAAAEELQAAVAVRDRILAEHGLPPPG